MFRRPRLLLTVVGQVSIVCVRTNEQFVGREREAKKENQKNKKKNGGNAKKARNMDNRQLLVPIYEFAYIKPTIKFGTLEEGRTCL